ncbi:MAG: tetratricopeptide repeat protein [Phycisphaerae bacterium]|nr:tetratricopeptide repeat protein [Phycisphaerae bacterium]
MKTYLFIPLLAAGLLLSGCNIYHADQATKRGLEAFDIAKEAKSHGDHQAANDNYRKAQLEFQSAVDHDPRPTDRHYKLARASQALKEYNRAIREYDQALQRFPGNGKAHSGKIDCLVQMNAPQEEIDDAVATAVSIVRQRDHGWIYLTLAVAYYRAGRTDQVAPALAKAVGAAPSDSYVQATAGRFYRAIGDFDSARKHLKIAYQLNPQEPDVAHDLGVLGERLPPVAGQ